MKAKPKTLHGERFSSSFDSQLKDAICRVRGISYAEKIKLYQDIIVVCHRQVEDCCECLTFAHFLNLHDAAGFGQKRINRLQQATQKTIDEYAQMYEIGMQEALRRDLIARNIFVKDKGENNDTV